MLRLLAIMALSSVLALQAATAQQSTSGGTRYDTSPATAPDRLDGIYDLSLPNRPGVRVAQFAIMTRGTHFSIYGIGQDWRGQGIVSGRTGHYDWRFTDGRIGWTDFTVEADDSLHGHTVGAGINWRFVARRQQVSVAAQKPPKDAIPSTALPVQSGRAVANSPVRNALPPQPRPTIPSTQPSNAESAAPPATTSAVVPLPQIETAMHIGPVIAAVTDAARRIAVTTGQDATARVWSLPDLRLLRVLRPPVGWPLGPQVALTPDGKFAALAAGAGALIYNMATGDIVQKIPLDQSWGPVNAMAISPDGSRLVIGRGPNGDGCWLFVFQLDGKPLWHKCGSPNAIFKEGAFALSFAADGRLAAASLGDAHAHLTLYDPAGNVLQSTEVSPEVSFDGLAFSPDGQHLALVHPGLRIEVRDGQSLALQATPDTHDLIGILPTFAWSPDSTTLYVTGMHAKDVRTNFGDPTPIYAWADSGKGARREAFSEQYRQHSLALLPKGRFFLISNWRTPVVLNGDGTPFAKVYADGADLREPPTGQENYFRVSRDGSEVELVTLDRPGEWLHIDVNNASVERPSTPGKDLTNWTVAGVKVEQKPLSAAMFDANMKSANANPLGPGAWFMRELQKSGVRPPASSDSSEPKVWLLNGHMLKLVEPCESGPEAPPRTSVSLPNQRVLTVTCGGLLIASRLGGGELWHIAAGGAANFVTKLNQSPDGRLVVTAHADGTIRWRRASDGRLMLTLYVDRTGDRWILFTPRGYYYASPDAEKFVGWIVRRQGIQAADFFSLGQFKELYRSREVVTRVLHTLDEVEAIRQAGIAAHGTAPEAALSGDLPPVVATVAPADGSEITGPDVTIDYVVRSPSGRPINDLAVQVDGRRIDVGNVLASLSPAAPDAEAHGHVTIPVSAGRAVTVSIIASTDTGRHSQPAWLRLRSGSQPLGTPLADQRGRLFALVVGISTYPRLQGQTLPSASGDAAEFTDLLRAPAQARLYSAVAVRLINDATGSPTRAAILDGLRWLRESATLPSDVAVLYIASHGYGNGERPDSFRIVPADGDLHDLSGSTISGNVLLDEVRAIPARLVVFLDTCHSGGMATSDVNPFAADAADPWNGTFIYASSSIDEASYEDEAVHHGLFTEALFAAIHGRMVVHDGLIRTDDLQSFIKDWFRAREAEKHWQTPAAVGPPLAPDFLVLAVVPTVAELTHQNASH